MNHVRRRWRSAGAWTVALGFGVLCSGSERAVAETTRTVHIYERTSQTLDELSAIVADENVFLPIAVLTERWGLQRKDLPGGRVGSAAERRVRQECR